MRCARRATGLRCSTPPMTSARLTQNLLAQGAAAEPLTRTIAALNDALSRQVIEMVLARHELPTATGAGWRWAARAAASRRSPPIRTMRWCSCRRTRPASKRERARLLAFARDVNTELDAIGFPLCTGNVMAGNPKMCLTVGEWQSRFLAMDPRADAGGAAGGQHRVRLPAAVRRHDAGGPAARLARRLHARQQDLPPASWCTTRCDTEPPLGLIRAFVTDDAGAQKGTLDLKARGTRIFVDAARVFALGFALPETGTAARLRVAGAKLNVERRHVDATIDGFPFPATPAAAQSARSRRAASSPTASTPTRLNEVDQRMLKESFRQARKLQQRLAQTYRL